MADKRCMPKSQMCCCIKNNGFYASCSCIRDFYFFVLCPVFNTPVCNHSGVQDVFIYCSKTSGLTVKECLCVYSNSNLAVLALDGQLNAVPSPYLKDYILDILYIKT